MQALERSWGHGKWGHISIMQRTNDLHSLRNAMVRLIGVCSVGRGFEWKHKSSKLPRATEGRNVDCRPQRQPNSLSTSCTTVETERKFHKCLLIGFMGNGLGWHSCQTGAFTDKAVGLHLAGDFSVRSEMNCFRVLENLAGYQHNCAWSHISNYQVIHCMTGVKASCFQRDN